MQKKKLQKVFPVDCLVMEEGNFSDYYTFFVVLSFEF